jgi:hypothetical protein
MTILVPVWDQPKPSFDDAQAMCSQVGLAFEEAQPASVAEVLDSLRESHVNGGAAFASFRVADSHTFDWFASRNRFAEYDILPMILRREEVRTRLPELRIPIEVTPDTQSQSCSMATADGFKMDDPFLFDGRLAHTLYAGGAYGRNTRLDARQAKLLALAACDDLFEQRFSDINLFTSYDAWTPWFQNVAWDWTTFLFDRRKRIFSVLAVTDTD